jgi:hypothetical protein
MSATTFARQERRVWDLLVEGFDWEVPPGHAVSIRQTSGESLACARVQIFELVVTSILARMRPEFRWSVTPDRRDQGLDFLGVQRFLSEGDLGIDAAITVGGQCKKKTHVNTVLNEIAGSLISMADAVNPTFFVVALSARLTRKRLDDARGKFERQCLRHCHILDRDQIEGLMAEHVDVVAEVLRQGLTEPDCDEVLGYLETRGVSAVPPSVGVSPPVRALSGVPLRVDVEIRWALAGNADARLWWRPRAGHDTGSLTLIGPIGAESKSGMRLMSTSAVEDPFSASCTLELVTYAIGQVDLGEVIVGRGPDAQAGQAVDLGTVEVIENMRPRFFDRPYRPALRRLNEAYQRVLAGVPCSLGVTGAGGSGKSRLCEEFALERRRRGCAVVTARHPKTHEAPLQIVADLLADLAGVSVASPEPAEDILQTLAQYDASLAAHAATAIRSLFGTRRTDSDDVSEQHVLSAILLLLVARSRRSPLIAHLQDLHWCSADVLSMLERLAQQLKHLSVAGTVSGPAGSRVMFLFEGRIRESGESGGDAWSSAVFEAFLARAESETVNCAAFTAEDSLDFARLLFEGPHNAHRLLADELLELQDDLVDNICEAAGGNPFHTLEQVRLLKEIGVVGQNPSTGLLFMIRPAPGGSVLPESVFAAIQQRWRYLRSRADGLALLVWGSALLDDRIPAHLFRRLWQELAPEVSVREIDATDMLWTGDGTAAEVVFRHENYFESIRRFTLSDADRQRVVEAYCSWFSELRRPSAAERFSWARVVLELPEPDRVRARALMDSALKRSARSGDPRLTRRILASYLDLTWELNDRSAFPAAVFLRHCDRERDLCRELLGIDRDQAATRIRRLRTCIGERLKALTDTGSPKTRDAVLLRLLTAEALHAQLLFNDRRPTESADIAEHVVESVRAQRFGTSAGDWQLLEMEALYTLSCGQAISGEFAPAVRSSAAAAEIATNSQSSLARKILSTYGTMLLSEDPRRGETVLRECLARWPEDDTSDAFLVHVHLSMALVLQAYRLGGRSGRHKLLEEAGVSMSRVHDLCRRLGLYPDAGAAALVRGVVSALADEGDEAGWFAQGVAAAARGRQMETLWRSHINLSLALYRKELEVTPTARDHALAALEIMEDTLSVYSEPESSPRFEMLQIGMAEAVWVLRAIGDERGLAALERYPRLRRHFTDPQAGLRAPYDDGPRHYQWLRVQDVDYILY